MNEPTCGKGLAEHSALPLRLAELIDALAENLELHMTTLELDDENARKERDAYARLAGQHLLASWVTRDRAMLGR